MYVKRLFYDDLSDSANYCPSCEIVNPDWDDVVNIIKKLDGRYISEVTMDTGDEDNYLCVAGGNDGLFILYISLDDNSECHTLLNPCPVKSRINKLVTGGQIADYEDKICVGIETVLDVAEIYFRTGRISDKYDWEIQGGVNMNRIYESIFDLVELHSKKFGYHVTSATLDINMIVAKAQFDEIDDDTLELKKLLEDSIKDGIDYFPERYNYNVKDAIGDENAILIDYYDH